jgi:MFS family permease
LGGAGHQSWVVTSYLLAYTVITAIVGKLGDLFRGKAVFLVAISFFLLGAILCGLAGSMTMLVASRADSGDQLGWKYVPVVRTNGHRALRGIGCGACGFRRG